MAPEEHPDLAALTHAPVTPAYPQIIAAFTGPLRAKDACQILGTDTDARHVEALRSKLKKLVARGILTEQRVGGRRPTTRGYMLGVVVPVTAGSAGRA